jgi:hypothetical protein
MAKAVVIRKGGKSKGGALTRAAEDVRKSGRHGDDMLVHINENEFRQMVAAYGEPTINPETGLPEFFLGNLVSALLPAALNTFTPIGSSVGNLVGSFLPGMSGGVTDFLGNALVGAGVGALTNSKNRGQGALVGALGGGFGPMLASGLGLQGVGTTGALGNMLGMFGGGGQAAGAAGGMTANGLPMNPPLPPRRPTGLGGALSGIGAQASGGGGMGGMLQQALPAALMLSALSGAGGGQKSAASAPPPEYSDEQRRVAADNARPLEQVSNVRFQKPTAAVRNYLRYGMDPKGEEEFYENNRLPSTTRAAAGGYVTDRGVLTRMAEGGMAGHGRSDHVEALLSPGEYVIDAESVSMLGNGSSEAGAGMLDRLREQLRKHKAEGLSQGRMSADSMPPERYMKGR